MTRSPSPWWALLILPVALAIGLLVGQMPTPATTGSNDSHPAGPEVVAVGARLEQRGSPRGAPSAEISAWTTMDGALAESRRNGKPILLDFSADWCGPCRRMKQEVFDGGRGQAVQAAVIPVSLVDRVREDGRNTPEVESLQRQYGVDAFPTLVVYSPATGRVMQTKGFGGGERTLAWIQEAAKAVR